MNGRSALIRGGRLVLGDSLTPGDVLIRGGTIAALLAPGTDVPGAAPLDADGLIVLPGLVDVHTHLRDPGYTPKEDFTTGTAAAAAGGFTTVVAQPNTDPPLATGEALDAARAIGQARALVDFGLAALARPGYAEDLPALRDHGAMIFEVLRADAPLEWLAVDAAAVRAILEAAARLRAPAAVYAADQRLIDLFTSRARSGDLPPAPAYLAGRPPEVEAVGIALLLEVARGVDATLLVRQVTTARGVDLIRQARRSGQRHVWAEVNPHHLFLTSADAASLGPRGKVAPPLRGEDDVAALWRGLADGTLSLVGTDHAPHTAAERTGDFWAMPAGLPALETALPLFTTAAAEGRVAFSGIARWLSRMPARFAGLYPRKGSLRPGADGDLTLVDPSVEWTVGERPLFTKAGWTPFAGWRVRGRVVATLVRGVVVFQDGEIRASPGYGQFLPPAAPGA